MSRAKRNPHLRGIHGQCALYVAIKGETHDLAHQPSAHKAAGCENPN